MTDWQNNLPPGTLPQDVSDRERQDEDEFWTDYWLYQGTEPEDKLYEQ